MLLRQYLLDNRGYYDRNHLFKHQFRHLFIDSILLFGLGQIDVLGPSGTHAKWERFDDYGFDILMDGTCAFGGVDGLLIIELFVDLLNGFLVA